MSGHGISNLFLQGSQDNATYVELCFPPPASFNMNGSQPCLNSLNSLQPLNKVRPLILARISQNKGYPGLQGYYFEMQAKLT